MVEYPTKQQILENPPGNIIPDIEILYEWKEAFYKGWKEKPIEFKFMALEELINKLGQHYAHPCNRKLAESYSYDPNTQTIIMNKEKPSIISTLHEFGHHLHGESELKACSYSVWMFKTVFPQVFKRMVWEGHLLKIQT